MFRCFAQFRFVSVNKLHSIIFEQLTVTAA
jgi:hypothetical protein